MFATVNSLVLNGIEAIPVQVEVDVQNGLPMFELVGLPSTSVREAKERVRSAIKNTGMEFPLRRITVNLAPADVRKEGSHFDLPIAIGILMASGQLEFAPLHHYWAGELSLEGTVKGIPGILPMVLALKRYDHEAVFVIPGANDGEASMAGMTCLLAPSLQAVVEYLRNGVALPKASEAPPLQSAPVYAMDFADIKGQHAAKRAIEVAVAGGHNLLLIGPPGSGKTMLARRIPTIMPDMTQDEILETSQIYSAAGLLNKELPLITTRPFRAPHRNASATSIIGGGRIPRPGEISLAQNGVLYMDEITEFSREVLESLRQPLEDRKVTITRTNGTSTYPCNFLLAASCNPCPCGHYGNPEGNCTCTPHQVSRYLHRLSGPLLDRMDVQIEVPRTEFEHLAGNHTEESSAAIKSRIEKAREIQQRRYAGRGYRLNAEMSPRDIRLYCRVDDKGHEILRQAFKTLGLSARGYDRVLKMARTAADLEGVENITAKHLAEVICYRGIERRYASAI